MFKKNSDGTYEFTRRFWITVTIMAIGFGVIAWNTQRVNNNTDHLYSETVAYAKQTNDCLNQLVSVQQLRARLNSDRDDLSEHQRFEFLAMFQSLLSPPPDIAALDQDHPSYRQWATDVVRTYVSSIAADQKKVEDIKTELAAHPVPTPTCGLKLPGER